jgi:hypothetical protein
MRSTGCFLLVIIGGLIALPFLWFAGVWMWNDQALPFSKPSYRLTIHDGAGLVQRLQAPQEPAAGPDQAGNRERCLDIRSQPGANGAVLIRRAPCKNSEGELGAQVYQLDPGSSGAATLDAHTSSAMLAAWEQAIPGPPLDFGQLTGIHSSRAYLRAQLTTAVRYGYEQPFHEFLDPFNDPLSSDCRPLDDCYLELSPSSRWVFVAGSTSSGYGGGGGFFDLSNLYLPSWTLRNSSIGVFDTVEGVWRMRMHVKRWQNPPSLPDPKAVYWVSDDQFLLIENYNPLTLLWVDLREFTAPIVPNPWNRAREAAVADRKATRSVDGETGRRTLPVLPQSLKLDGVLARTAFPGVSAAELRQIRVREREFSHVTQVPVGGQYPFLRNVLFNRKSTREVEAAFACMWSERTPQGLVIAQPGPGSSAIAFHVSGTASVPGIEVTTQPASVRCNGELIRLRARLSDRLPHLGPYRVGIALSTQPELRAACSFTLHPPEHSLDIGDVTVGRNDVRFHAQAKLLPENPLRAGTLISIGSSLTDLWCTWMLRQNQIEVTGRDTDLNVPSFIREKCKAGIEAGNPNVWLHATGEDHSRANLYRAEPRSDSRPLEWSLVPVARRPKEDNPTVVHVSPGDLRAASQRFVVYVAAKPNEVDGVQVTFDVYDQSSTLRCGLRFRYRKGGTHEWTKWGETGGVLDPMQPGQPECQLDGEDVSHVYPGLIRLRVAASALDGIDGEVLLQATSEGGAPSLSRFLPVLVAR